MIDGLNNYVSAGWEAWISCARSTVPASVFLFLETRNFILPSFLIVLLRAVIEPEHENLMKGAKAEAAVSTQIGDYRRGNFYLVTDLVFFTKSNKGLYTAMPEGLSRNVG